MTEIINDVLSVSRVEAKRLSVHRVPTDPVQRVREVTLEVGEGDRHAHEFDFHPSGSSGTVVADVKLLHHIVSNVVGHAVEYSPGGTTVRIALPVGEAGFTLTVADEGIGVPPGEANRIFDPFGRASNVGEIGGTGLGLDIVRRFPELMGGRIDVVPSAKGATFRINIPLNAGSLAMPPPDLSSGVLIVEDDEMLRTNLAEILELEGFIYAAARNGAEGLAMARETRPGVIVSDAAMPVLSGFDMLRALRADAGTRHIPVIILSAAIEPERRQLGLELGATDYIIKPFRVETLVDTILLRLGRKPAYPGA